MATLTISDSMYSRVEQRVKQSEFESVDEYTTFVLEEVLDQIEGERTDDAGDRDEVLDKLRDLGYLE